MSTIDWLVGGLVLTVILLIGLLLGRQPGTLQDRFTASRTLPWYALGGAMAATGFSADTPLLITGAVYQDGMSGNWFWWISAPGVLATLFFFSRLWRRSGILTEVELFKLRYGNSTQVAYFRAFKALIDGVLVNALVVASITTAVLLVSQSVINPSTTDNRSATLPVAIACSLLMATSIYTALTGFRGAVRVSVLGFATALIMSSLVAFFAWQHLPGEWISVTRLIAPRTGLPVTQIWPSSLSSILLLSCIGWIHTAPGNGMLIQRIVSARNEIEASKIVLTYAILHYLVRPWPWYLVGIMALAMFPALPKPEMAFIEVAAAHLPSGLLGMLTAALLLAALASIHSRLNFGASLVVNDIALPITHRTQLTHRVTLILEWTAIAIIAATALLVVGSGLVLTIRAFYQFFIVLAAGTGFAGIARWYWWRMTLRGEISSLVSAVIVALIAAAAGDIEDPQQFPIMLLVNLVTGALICCITADWHSHQPPACATAFWTKVHLKKLESKTATPKKNLLIKPAIYWVLLVIVFFLLIALTGVVLQLS